MSVRSLSARVRPFLIGLSVMLVVIAIDSSPLSGALGFHAIRSGAEQVMLVGSQMIGDARVRFQLEVGSPAETERLYRRIAELERQLSETVGAESACLYDQQESQAFLDLQTSGVCVPSGRKTELLTGQALLAGQATLTLGSSDGVRDQDFILKNGVVVGVVREPGRDTSLFDPLTQLRQPVKVLIQHPTQESHEGLLYSRGGQGVVEYLQLDAEIHPESLVVTSTSPTGFPVPIGRLGRKASTDQDLHQAYQVVFLGSVQHRDMVSVLVLPDERTPENGLPEERQ